LQKLASDEEQEGPSMRLLIWLIIIVYLVGVGVVLEPSMAAKWSTAPASEMFAGMLAELPGALAWPVKAYHILRPEAAPTQGT
jgi:hypothetical protein